MKITDETIKFMTDGKGNVELYKERAIFSGDRLYIKGDFDAVRSRIKITAPSMFVCGTVDLTGSWINGIPEYTTIRGSLILDNCKGIKSIPNGVTIQGSLSAKKTKIKEIGKGLIVGCNLDLSGSKIKNLPNGLTVAGNLDLRKTRIKNIPTDLVVGGYLLIDKSRVKDVPPCVKVGKGIDTIPFTPNNAFYTKLKDGDNESQRFIYCNGRLFHIMGRMTQKNKTIYLGKFKNENVVYDGVKYSVATLNQIYPSFFSLKQQEPIGNADRCVSCGAYAVEGTQLCKKCENKKNEMG